IRTSTDGKVGLPRDANGTWRTLRKVQMVVVATVSPDDRRQVEVYGFDSQVLEAEFDNAVKTPGKGNRNKQPFSAPVFLPLFRTRKGIGAWKEGLSSRAIWKESIKTADLSTSQNPASSSQALDVLRANIAQGLGVHPNRVE